MAGSSNFTSWVRTATASAGPSPISSATSSGQPTTSRSTSGNRSRVANAARPSTTTVSNPSSRAIATSGIGDLDRADDDEPRPDRERLDEHVTARRSPRSATCRAARASSGGRDAARRPHGVAERPVEDPVVADDERRGGRRSLARARAARTPAGGASAGSGMTIARPPDRCRTAPRGAAATAAADRRLDEHVDRPAAGQPDVPGLLVADPVADDPGVRRRGGLARSPRPPRPRRSRR